MTPPTRRAVLLYLSATFILGAVAGGAVGYGFGRRPIFGPFDREAMRARMCDEITRSVGLTPEQQTQLDPLVRQGMEEFEAVHREEMARIREVMRKGHDRIAAILTPEQKVKFDAMERERESRRQLHPRGDNSPPKPRPSTK
jgi:Spy/CpxP family protein refolding chaperone